MAFINPQVVFLHHFSNHKNKMISVQISTQSAMPVVGPVSIFSSVFQTENAVRYKRKKRKKNPPSLTLSSQPPTLPYHLPFSHSDSYWNPCAAPSHPKPPSLSALICVFSPFDCQRMGPDWNEQIKTIEGWAQGWRQERKRCRRRRRRRKDCAGKCTRNEDAVKAVLGRRSGRLLVKPLSPPHVAASAVSSCLQNVWECKSAPQ